MQLMSTQAFLIVILLSVMICSTSQSFYLEACVIGCVAAFIQGFLFFTSVVMLQDAARGTSQVTSFGFYIFTYFFLQRWVLISTWAVYEASETEVFFYMFLFLQLTVMSISMSLIKKAQQNKSIHIVFANCEKGD